MIVKKSVSGGAKPPAILFLQLMEEQEWFRDVFFSFLGGEDGGRKAAGKKTKVRRSFPGDIVHSRLRL